MSRLKIVEKVGAVGDIEERQGADRHVQIDRIDIVAEDALPLAPRQQIAQRIDGRNIEALDRLRTGNVSPVQNVLVHDQAHKFRMGVLVVEGDAQ